jgi:ATP-dependent Lon protease
MSSSSLNTYVMRPLLDVVIMPKVSTQVVIDRSKIIQWESIRQSDEIVILSRKNKDTDDPSIENMNLVGTLVEVTQDEILPSTGRKIILSGLQRFVVDTIKMSDDGPMVSGYVLKTIINSEAKIEASKRLVIEKTNHLIRASILKDQVYRDILALEDAEHLLDMLANKLPSMSLATKQEILETACLEKRYEVMLTHLSSELEISRMHKKLHTRIRDKASKQTQEYYDRLKNQAIRDEFGEDNELDLLAKRINSIKMSKEAKKKAESELKKLRNMNAISSEAVVIRHYLEKICELPWQKKDPLESDLSLAEKHLDETHFGLPNIKKEISKHIAVYNRTKGTQGTVLCLVGPPGVGKTSLGKSIAAATKRKFARIALGGVKDEAEIRGHRRTYVGSLPGKIIQELIRCNSMNPLFMLDEIDKIGQDWRGDPAAGLLEVLDPEQNEAFVDHYLEVSFPLNECMFICTANDISKIPPALLDRMDIIQLSSYTQEEKVSIGKKHLLPKQRNANGLTEKEFSISVDALQTLVQKYTCESGVRDLERKIKSLASLAVLLIDTGKKKLLHINKTNLEKYAGPPVYTSRGGSQRDQVGIINGMSWSEVGGSLLTIETVQVSGTGKVLSTGRLGKVMEESVTIAFSFLRATANQTGVDLKQLDQTDLHVHVPEGATPKDGPSAGVAIYLSMLSSLLKVPISNTVAVTGEISLTGQVWTIGGLKEKILAAHRGGVKTVLIPETNKAHLVDIPEAVLSSMNIVYMTTANDAIAHAFVGYKKAELPQ